MGVEAGMRGEGVVVESSGRSNREKKLYSSEREYLISVENGWGNDTLCPAIPVQVCW